MLIKTLNFMNIHLNQRELADAIMESKKSNYHFAVFERNKDTFRKFWDAVREGPSIT